jgi:acyl-coenzyme A thioesterase PaaI-like protein
MLLEPNPANHCFGCGGANSRGMRLAFEQDDSTRRIRGIFRIGGDYQGGPGFVHGGIVATLLDEVMAKVNRFAQEIAMTAELAVEYKKPVPIDEDLLVEGWETERDGRVRLREGEIRDASGALLARGRAKFVAIDPARFAALNAKPQRDSSKGAS